MLPPEPGQRLPRVTCGDSYIDPGILLERAYLQTDCLPTSYRHFSYLGPAPRREWRRPPSHGREAQHLTHELCWVLILNFVRHYLQLPGPPIKPFGPAPRAFYHINLISGLPPVSGVATLPGCPATSR